jgi:DNA-binding NtrC family response regulator
VAAAQFEFPDPHERTPTLLIVDDEPLIRMVLSDFLQECGFKVLEASSADEAMQMIESTSVSIDLVVSDVRMPGERDGYGLARWVRGHAKKVPVILCSGDATKTTAAQELCAKEPFFAKPYDLQMVVAQIRRSLGLEDRDTAAVK